MDLTGKKQAALEAELERARAEVKELRGEISWLLSIASDEQIIAWAADAGKHLSEMPDKEPDWEGRATRLMTQAYVEIAARDETIARLKKELSAPSHRDG
jgi:hypothetical protein